MAKYSFAQMGPERFEGMIKALLEQRYRTEGHLIQFGPGKDGAREATWTQPTTHPDYNPPTRGKRRPREWVFQVKYHDTVRAVSKDPVSGLVSDLNSELDKLLNKYETTCHTYVLATNLPLSGVHLVGGRDRIERAASKWKSRLDVHVWDEATISAMIDANLDVRTTYLDQILPGDILASLLHQTQRVEHRRRAIMHTYLTKLLKSSDRARSDEAGDEAEKPLQLEDVYIDLTVSLVNIPDHPHEDARSAWAHVSNKIAAFQQAKAHVRTARERTLLPASSVLLLSPHEATLIQAGPGFGKSTIGQFLTAFHAARLLPEMRTKWARLVGRMLMPPGVTATEFDSMCAPRLPFRIELRRYADWRLSHPDGGIATYLVEVVNRDAEASLTRDDLYEVASSNPILLILDGLDEVPNHESRKTIIADAGTFLTRTKQAGSSVQVLLTTRPQGYNREFDVFEPASWVIESLSRSEFDEYCTVWLNERVEDVIERSEALARVQRGMQSLDVARLATTLLQSTVILTIAKNKHDIPHERSSLFEKYVEVIFEREKSKSSLVKTFEQELRRLHELAGYRLHKAMESGAGGTISDTGFRHLVRETWDTYSGLQPLPQGLSPALDSIVEAAQNRLVFLRGEGESQSDIGFLLSSFREYFAAAYVRNDERADRDRVFRTLLSHVSHWENVLLFYSGFQDPSDQRRWIDHLEDLLPVLDESEMRFEAVRFRRALLKMLPEFRRLKSRTFEKALREVFHPDTLWSWRYQVWAGDIIKALRLGTELTFVVDLLCQLASSDRDSFLAAFELAAEISPREGPSWESLKSALNKHSMGQLCDLACESAIENSIPIDKIGTLNATDLGRMLDSHGGFSPMPPEVAILTPPAVASELLTKKWSVARHWLRAHPVVKSISSMLDEDESSRVAAEAGIVPMSYFSSSRRVFTLEKLRLALDPLDVSKTPLGGYLLALADAMEHPVNPEADNKARAIQKSIEFENATVLSCDQLLGPPVEMFESHTNWRIFKQKLVECRQDVNWRPSLLDTFGSVSSHDWIRTLFHPMGWKLLHEHCSFLTPLPTSTFAHSLVETVLRCAPKALDVLHPLTLELTGGSTRRTLDMVALAAATLSITESHGRDAISSSMLPAFVSSLPTGKRAWVEIRSLFEKAAQLQWPDGWTSLFLVLALGSKGCPAESVFEFWRNNECSWLYLAGDETDYSDAFRDILPFATSGDASAAEFGAELVNGFDGTVDEVIGIPLADRFASELKRRRHDDDASLFERFAGALLRLPLSLTSFSLLADAAFYQNINNHLLTAAARRVSGERSVGSAMEGMPLEFAERILDDRLEFPNEIVVAAALRSIALRGKSVGTINDILWQMEGAETQEPR